MKLAYADDLALEAKTEEEIKSMLERFTEYVENEMAHTLWVFRYLEKKMERKKIHKNYC